MDPTPAIYDITLLYVEDEASTREHLTLLLKDRVKQFLCAQNGVEGLDLYLKHSPDIVLTDIIMPVMDGLTMARMIRKHSRDVPIIALTALSDSDNLISAIDVGISKFILKPVALKNLFSSIESCLEVINLRRSLKAQNDRIQLLSTALEQSPCIILITDTKGRIEEVNHKFCEVTGYSAEEAIGKTPRILKSGESSREVYDSIWSTIIDGRSWHGILQNRKKNGELYWEYSSISPIKLGDGKTVKYLKTAEDITELRKTEEEAVRLKQQESITVLAAGIAHDFNNLLQVIVGNILLAKIHSPPDSKAFELLSVAESSTKKAGELSRKLRSLIKSEDGMLHPAPLASVVLTAVKATLKGSNVRLVEKISHDIVSAKFNISQMQLVVTNITNNAIEAMPDGGTLEVSAENCSISENNNLQLPPGRYAHLIFSDTGVGIPPENLSRIFNPYFTTKELGARKGVGLSLASCHSIIKNHHGAITAESAPDAGCRIHIYLPTAEHA